jgi:hypothetical protein
MTTWIAAIQTAATRHLMAMTTEDQVSLRKPGDGRRIEKQWRANAASDGKISALGVADKARDD